MGDGVITEDSLVVDSAVEMVMLMEGIIETTVSVGAIVNVVD